jgi:hypothetical protein
MPGIFAACTSTLTIKPYKHVTEYSTKRRFLLATSLFFFSTYSLLLLQQEAVIKIGFDQNGYAEWVLSAGGNFWRY